MNRHRWNTLLSTLLLIPGAVLLFQGSRTVVESRLAQSAAAREYLAPVAVPRGPHHGDVIARLTIPRLTTDLYVVEGDDPGDLRRGPGHLADSAMPGSRGNCVIAGHRDTHFRVLKDLHKGDGIELRRGAQRFLYRVESISIVSPSNTHSLQPTSRPVLHLVTCYPFSYVGAAPQRLVVEASLSDEASGDEVK
jgi:sortase A